jgi:tetratricopeptide (TPR) repeat protein
MDVAVARPEARMKAAAALLAVSLGIFGPSRKSARQGARAYRQGNFAESEKLFGEAARQEPDNPLWRLDHGTALARGGQADAARTELARAAESKDAAVAAAAFYQLGTIDLEQRRFREAAERLRRSLELDPSTRGAKRNYEIALRNLRRSPPPPPSSGGSRKPAPPDRQTKSKAPKPDSEFQKRAGMSRAEAERLLRSLDAEQRRNEKTEAGRGAKDW